MTMLLIQLDLALVKKGHMFGERVSTKMVVYPVAIYQYFMAKQEATNYWYTCARAAFNDPDWFVETTTQFVIKRERPIRHTWRRIEKHGKNTAIDTNKTWKNLRSENMELRRKLGEAKQRHWCLQKRLLMVKPYQPINPANTRKKRRAGTTMR